MVSDARLSRTILVDVEPVTDRSLKMLLSHTITGCRKPATLIYRCAASFTALYGIGPIRNSGSDDNHLICARPDATLSRIVGDT
jgi:hypothetical protein